MQQLSIFIDISPSQSSSVSFPAFSQTGSPASPSQIHTLTVAEQLGFLPLGMLRRRITGLTQADHAIIVGNRCLPWVIDATVTIVVEGIADLLSTRKYLRDVSLVVIIKDRFLDPRHSPSLVAYLPIAAPIAIVITIKVDRIVTGIGDRGVGRRARLPTILGIAMRELVVVPNIETFCGWTCAQCRKARVAK